MGLLSALGDLALQNCTGDSPLLPKWSVFKNETAQAVLLGKHRIWARQALRRTPRLLKTECVATYFAKYKRAGVLLTYRESGRMLCINFDLFAILKPELQKH